MRMSHREILELIALKGRELDQARWNAIGTTYRGDLRPAAERILELIDALPDKPEA